MAAALLVSAAAASDGPPPRSRDEGPEWKKARRPYTTSQVEPSRVHKASHTTSAPKLNWRPIRASRADGALDLGAGATRAAELARQSSQHDFDPFEAGGQSSLGERTQPVREPVRESVDETVGKPVIAERPDPFEAPIARAATRSIQVQAETEDLPAPFRMVPQRQPMELVPPSANRREGSRPVQTQEDCEEARRQLNASRIASIGLDIRVSGRQGDDFPIECTLGDDAFEPRLWHETIYTWKASALCHKPLYFEEQDLERYGHSCGKLLEPLVSGAHFFGTLPILPYKMGLEPPHECIYVLGHYRPGSCAPYLLHPIPFSLRAALFEAGAWVGGVAVIP